MAHCILYMYLRIHQTGSGFLYIWFLYLFCDFWLILKFLFLLCFLQHTHTVPLCTKHHVPWGTRSMKGSSVFSFIFLFLQLLFLLLLTRKWAEIDGVIIDRPLYTQRANIKIQILFLHVFQTNYSAKPTINTLPMNFSALSGVCWLEPFVPLCPPAQSHPLKLCVCHLAESTVTSGNKWKQGQCKLVKMIKIEFSMTLSYRTTDFIWWQPYEEDFTKGDKYVTHISECRYHFHLLAYWYHSHV